MKMLHEHDEWRFCTSTMDEDTCTTPVVTQRGPGAGEFSTAIIRTLGTEPGRHEQCRAVSRLAATASRLEGGSVTQEDGVSAHHSGGPRLRTSRT